MLSADHGVSAEYVGAERDHLIAEAVAVLQEQQFIGRDILQRHFVPVCQSMIAR